ncbi:MAG: HPr(Ser) kinase/phosphatase [Deltaproteobacteria bacterium]|nr:HPr(Ser) kinase/phosphatase [Deltaproteobacteria bacterium]
MQSTRVDNPLKIKEIYGAWGKELQIELISGYDGLNREIRSNRVQKPGLRMIEPDIQLEEGKIQVLGMTEVSYFDKLSFEEQENVADVLTTQDVPCFIISKGLTPPELLKKSCEKRLMPLLTTKLGTGRLISILNGILEERLAPFVSVHGVFIDIHGLGVLILGKSGIGKSECALDLILRGSKLIADDVVEIRRLGTSKLIGSGPENIKHLMEIRGVGIVNIKDLFGMASVMDKREIDMVIELAQWDPNAEYDRLGLDQNIYTIMEVNLPYLVLPVSPGRNTATIVEVAVRNQLLRSSGICTAEELQGQAGKHSATRGK